MIVNWLLFKIKALFLIIPNLFRRALCCIRKRRHSYSDIEPLTHVTSGVEGQSEAPAWTEWSEDSFRDNKPRTVQDYIELYREQTMKARMTENVEENPEEQLNFFEDMTPQITTQTKVLIKSKNDSFNKRNVSSRLNVVEDTDNIIIPSSELEEWSESSGWEGENLLDQEAQKVLREQKRLEREKKAWEQHQKRLEKMSRTLGSKLST
ncbi:receptor-binding cancer antigen expressed on SiSo cells [Anthonomus grandis grandis]|uniref:receptor-binding cancer antigen expressed on SiSo cells n=1 Tax=Anthonomus grandis grandis TaxID=2921223 RepID=UPI0021664E4A|nr:receptor-binding cancer antigen expressed on SiSo cells [Anthonomus grandis grandis]